MALILDLTGDREDAMEKLRLTIEHAGASITDIPRRTLLAADAVQDKAALYMDVAKCLEAIGRRLHACQVRISEDSRL